MKSGSAMLTLFVKSTTRAVIAEAMGDKILKGDLHPASLRFRSVGISPVRCWEFMWVLPSFDVIKDAAVLGEWGALHPPGPFQHPTWLRAQAEQ